MTIKEIKKLIENYSDDQIIQIRTFTYSYFGGASYIHDEIVTSVVQEKDGVVLIVGPTSMLGE